MQNKKLDGAHMIVRRATLNDLTPLAVLFDEYRQVYGEASNISLAEQFLKQRFENAETVIFVHVHNEKLTGFVILYRGFSSIRCRIYYILDDVYVTPISRRQGAARQLIDTATLFAEHEGAAKIRVETPKNAAQAHQLYESMGFCFDDSERAYQRLLNH